VKLYDSNTDERVNGSAPTIDDDEQIEEDETQEYDYSQLFDAPNYADFIKTKPNSNAQKYEKRVQGMMKAGLIMSINNQQWPDAATFLKHGPGFAKAAGNLAAEDARAAQLIEMLTAPSSPYVTFAMVAIPFIAQLTRNHQSEFKEAGQSWRERRAEKKQQRLSGAKPKTPPITVRLGRRRISLPIRVRLRVPNVRGMFKAFLAPTQHPQQIASEVFTDPAVRIALHKMGIVPREETDAA
jgi:hypothetical protein